MLMPCLIPIVSLTYLSKLWYLFILLLDIASLAELVDALALGASTERYGSSSLPARTNQISITFHYGRGTLPCRFTSKTSARFKKRLRSRFQLGRLMKRSRRRIQRSRKKPRYRASVPRSE